MFVNHTIYIYMCVFNHTLWIPVCSSLYLTCCSRDVKGLWRVLYTTYETMKKNVCYVVLSIVIWLVVPINIYTRSFKSTETNDNVLCSEIIRFFMRRYCNNFFNLNHNVLFYLILWNKNRYNELIQRQLFDFKSALRNRMYADG